MHAAPRNGDFVTPTIVGAEEYDFAERDLRYTVPMFQLLTNDREFADHNRTLLMQWMSVWVPRAISAARTLQPLWSQPEAKPPRFEDGLDAAQNRFAGIVTDLHLGVPRVRSLRQRRAKAPASPTARPPAGAACPSRTAR